MRACVPVHQLLHRDGERRRDQRQQTGRGRFLFGREDALHGTSADQHAGGGQHDGEHDRRNALKALVTVGMIPVRLACGKLDADDDDKTAQYVRSGVYRVADHRARVSKYTGEKLEERERRVSGDAHKRDAGGLALHLSGVVHRGAVFFGHQCFTSHTGIRKTPRTVHFTVPWVQNIPLSPLWGGPAPKARIIGAPACSRLLYQKDAFSSSAGEKKCFGMRKVNVCLLIRHGWTAPALAAAGRT